MYGFAWLLMNTFSLKEVYILKIYVYISYIFSSNYGKIVKSNSYFAQFFRMSYIYERKGYFIKKRSGISLFKVKCVIVVKGNILWNYFLKIIYRDNISNRIFFGKNVFILCLKDKSIVLIHLQEFAKVTCSGG